MPSEHSDEVDARIAEAERSDFAAVQRWAEAEVQRQRAESEIRRCEALKAGQEAGVWRHLCTVIGGQRVAVGGVGYLVQPYHGRGRDEITLSRIVTEETCS